MRDPYEVLGVDRKASAADIKSAFRRLAKKLHPDANKNDPKAASRFAEINAAYEILGEEDKRKAFDRGEIDAEGKPRFQGFEASAAPRPRARAAALARRRLSRLSASAPRALPGAPGAAVRARRRRWRLRGYPQGRLRRRGAARRAQQRGAASRPRISAAAPMSRRR